MSDLVEMDIAEFRALGLLQEINRQILHPLGLAMFVDRADDGSETLGGVYDLRSDPEGWVFRDLAPDDAERARALLRMRDERAPARIRAFGFVVQPLTGEAGA